MSTTFCNLIKLHISWIVTFTIHKLASKAKRYRFCNFSLLGAIPQSPKTVKFFDRLRIHFVNAFYFSNKENKKVGNYRLHTFSIIALLYSFPILFNSLFFTILHFKKCIYIMFCFHIVCHLFFCLTIFCICHFFLFQKICIFFI